MTIDEIVTLIQAVSDNGLTSFVYEEGDQKLILKKKKKKITYSSFADANILFTSKTSLSAILVIVSMSIPLSFIDIIIF